jgi:hypothetical protein
MLLRLYLPALCAAILSTTTAVAYRVAELPNRQIDRMIPHMLMITRQNRLISHNFSLYLSAICKDEPNAVRCLLNVVEKSFQLKYPAASYGDMG